jgi:hypothetical protein
MLVEVMNSFHIKIIAVVGMILSHLGIFLMPEHRMLGLLGNIAFPLFAWLIANGAHHTSDIQVYLRRLFFFALVSQVPFTLANQQIGSPLLYLNVFFTLFLGLLAISALKKTSDIPTCFVVIFGCASIAQICNTDYGAAGVLSIVAFYLFFNSILYTALSQICILFLIPTGISYWAESTGSMIGYIYLNHPVWLLGILAALGIVAFYNGREGYKTKYPFYVFYPIHYLAIFIYKLVF